MGIVGSVLSKACDDALHVHIYEIVHDLRLFHEVLVTVGADDRISGFRSLFFYSVKYGGVEMCHQIRYHHPDYFRRLASQAAGKGIRAVVEFLGKCFHTLLHVKSYLRAVAQRTANGGYADTKLLCQIFQ